MINLENHLRAIMQEMIYLEENYRVPSIVLDKENNQVDIKPVWMDADAETRFNNLAEQWKKINEEIMKGILAS